MAFSPIRTLVKPAAAPTQVSDELRAAITKLAPAVPQIAALFGIVVPEGAAMPRPPRITRRPEKKPAPKAPTRTAPEAVAPEAVAPAAVAPAAVAPEAVAPEAVAPEAVAPESSAEAPEA